MRGHDLRGPGPVNLGPRTPLDRTAGEQEQTNIYLIFGRYYIGIPFHASGSEDFIRGSMVMLFSDSE